MKNSTYGGIAKISMPSLAIKAVLICTLIISLSLCLTSCDRLFGPAETDEPDAPSEGNEPNSEPEDETSDTTEGPTSVSDEDSGVTGREPESSTEEPTESVTETNTVTEPRTDESTEEPTENTTEKETEGATEPLDTDLIFGYKVDLKTERSLGLEFENTHEDMVSTGSVWLRNYPDLSNTARAIVIEAHCAVELIGKAGEWCRIGYQGKVYYVRSHYLVKDEPQNGPTGIYYEGSGNNKDFVIAIDAGHQNFGMSDTEPNAPGSSIMKAKVTSGTIGTVTHIWEHELNLDVAMRLKKLLLDAGFSVVMIRESGNVTISNIERAEIANKYGVDAFVRIHANSASNTDAKGALTMCQSKNNKYNGELYGDSYALSKLIIDEFCTATGLGNRGVTETDTMTGINWCQVPVTIVEMGFMSNAEEDRIMATEEFRQNAANGIFVGILRYAKLKTINA